MKSNFVRSLSVLLCGASLACAAASGPAGGAAAPPSSRTTPEQALTARAQSYWQARQRKDLGGMYEFYSAGYRSRHTKDDFLKKTRLVRFDILEFKIDAVAISGDRADVTIAYRTYSPPKIMDPIQAKVTEKWILDPDRKWYKERETILLPFPGKLGTPEEVED
ncbi:MAG TPA: hypothetical protein VIZ69_09720 [Thermoanaerobaculia bacterium]